VAQAKRKPLKRIKMGNGFRWSFGGKLVSAAKAKQIKAARKLTGTKPRTNPTKKRKTVKRKAVRVAKPATGRRYVRSNPTKKRKTVSAATRRKISLALKRHHRGAQSNPPKRRKTVAKKKAPRRNPAAKRKTSRKKTRYGTYGTKAYFSAIGRKGARKAKRNPPKRKRKTTAKKSVKRNPGRYKTVSKRYSKQRLYLRRKPGGKKVSHRIKKVGRKTRKTGARSFHYAIVKRNPGMKDVMGTIKKVLPIYGGFVLARVGMQLFDTQVVKKSLAKTLADSPSMAKVAPLIAPAATFLLSAFLGPKMFKGPTGGAILEGLQLGSLMTVFDQIGKQFIAKSLPPQINMAFGGYDDMGVMGMGAYVSEAGMGGYLTDPTGYALPPAHATMEPGMGVDVNEAMALDSYVADDGGMSGYSAQEALADSESDYMQRGGAGGSLSRTVFTH